mgnify:CR=1 FL=1
MMLPAAALVLVVGLNGAPCASGAGCRTPRVRSHAVPCHRLPCSSFAWCAGPSPRLRGGVNGGSRVSRSAVVNAATQQSPAGLGFNSHKPVSDVPDSLCRPDDGNADTQMRQKFERMCRAAQNKICAAIEEIDGTKFREDAWTRDGALRAHAPSSHFGLPAR